MRDDADGLDEAVAVARDGLDVARVRGVVAEVPADFFDALRERAVADDYIVPHLCEEPILLDELPMLSYEEREGIEVACVEGHAVVSAPELPVGRVEEEVAELVAYGHISHAHRDLRWCSCCSRSGFGCYAPSVRLARPRTPHAPQPPNVKTARHRIPRHPASSKIMHVEPPPPSHSNSPFTSLLVPVLVASVGCALMVYMMYAEGEPGAVPLLLAASGGVGYFAARLRAKP